MVWVAQTESAWFCRLDQFQ